MVPKRKIGNKFLSLLIPSICGTFLFLALAIVTVQYKVLSAELTAKGERTAKLLAFELVNPVWNVDTIQIQELLDATKEDKEIVAIEVASVALRDLVQSPPNSAQGSLLAFSRPLVRKGDDLVPGDVNIGVVTVYLTQNMLVTRIRIGLVLVGVTLVTLLVIVSYLNRVIQRRVITRPLGVLVDGITKNTDYQTFDPIIFTSDDELGFLADAFNTMLAKLKEHSDSLKRLNADLEHRVSLRTKQLSGANEKLSNAYSQLSKAMGELWGEMQLAKKIQRVLLPEHPVIPGYDILVSMVPADDVGGDYYDVISVDGHNWIIIGDVSGHGVPAGLVMMMVQTAIHTVLMANPKTSTSELLAIINSSVYQNIRRMDEQKHMTIVVLALESDGRFVFSGLHEDILLWREATGKVTAVRTNGMWIGIEPNISEMLQVDELTLEIGDCMVLITDGVIEAKKDGVFFGSDRLVEVIEASGHSSAAEVHTSIRSALEDYSKPDDSVVMVVKREF